MNLITLRHRIANLLVPTAEIDRVEHVNPVAQDGEWALRVTVTDGHGTRVFKLTIEEEL